MDKVDFVKANRSLYSAPRDGFVLVDVPPMRYLAVDGAGDPNTVPAYREAVEALYGAAYTLKFMSRAEAGRDYVVPPLEGLWWADDMADFAARRKDAWSWTMMIAVPGFVSAELARAAIDTARDRKRLPASALVRYVLLEEGRAVQTLHVGPYDTEGPLLARLHDEYLPAAGLVETGHHHEIYLGDPRRSAPERLRTLLRQPVKPRPAASA